MKIRDIMTADVHIARRDQSIKDAAKMMAEIDSGFLPVADGDRLVGMLTDRDIAIRAVAKSKGPETPVGETMTHDVKYCFEDEDTDHVAHNMAEEQIRRLPVLDRNKRLVGVVSLADLALRERSGLCSDALAGISQPGGKHSQTAA